MVIVPIENLETTNLAMPVEFAREFRRIGDAYGEKNKVRWAVAAAAVLKLLEMPDKERSALIRALMGARREPDVLQQMVEDAKLKAMPEATPIPPRPRKPRPASRPAPKRLSERDHEHQGKGEDKAR